MSDNNQNIPEVSLDEQARIISKQLAHYLGFDAVQILDPNNSKIQCLIIANPKVLQYFFSRPENVFKLGDMKRLNQDKEN